jgi:hypothetical protein
VKKFKDDKKNLIFKMFVYAFTLIQNSINIDQMIVYLKNVHNIFCNKFLDQTVLFSMAIVRDELKTRGLNKLNASQYLVDVDEKKSELLNNQPKTKVFWFKEMSSDNEKEKLIEESPYRAYFENLLSSFNNDLFSTDTDETNITRKKNPYYNIKLFGVIKNMLYLAPLWTGIMLEQCKNQNKLCFKESFSRENNNPVENYFGHLKDDILQKLKNLLTSEIASRLYLRLKAKYIEFYLCKYSARRPKIVKRIDQKKLKNHKTPTHNWKKNIKTKRVKGIYYQSIQDYGNFEMARTENMIETADFSEIFSENHKTNETEFDQMDFTEQIPDKEEYKMDTSDNTVFSSQRNFFKPLQPSKEKVEEDHENKYYYLKFLNKKNGCYANTVIQCLLGLGNSFFEFVDLMPIDYPLNDTVSNEDSTQFWKELKMFISKYRSFTNEVICSIKFRNIIDQISNF